MRQKTKFRSLFLTVTSLFLLSSCAPNDLNSALKNVEQNVLSYLDAETENQLLIPEDRQKALMADYLAHYFSPWDNMKDTKLNEKIKQTESKLAEDFQKNPGWGQNHQPHSTTWIGNVTKNMDLKSFPNHLQRAIITEPANLRLLPTRRPSFASLKDAGQGFPFDTLQTSFLPENLPVLILHTSKDKAWHLVSVHNAFGWISSRQTALVNDAFVKEWKTGKYITPSGLETSLKSNTGQFLIYLRLGHLYPTTANEDKKKHTILIAQKNLNNEAVIKKISIEEKLMQAMPIPITPYHIGLLANEIVGQPYGWGGLYGHRDCSSTMADLFAPFGIWLPRNSSDQLKAWKHISLEKLKNAEKKKLIEKQGIPMITMIGWPGHVVLYLGTHNNQAYVLNTIWGLKTTLLSGRTGRAILGKTVVNPIDLGSEYLNIKATLLDKATTMTFLGE